MTDSARSSNKVGDNPRENESSGELEGCVTAAPDEGSLTILEVVL
jgi:hypothetical protein